MPPLPQKTKKKKEDKVYISIQTKGRFTILMC
jgi:hypothetical protein